VEREQAKQRLRAPTPARCDNMITQAQQTGSPRPDADAISWQDTASRNEDDDEAA
jgi:hypothetical protein